jgi:hypothetical protein
MGLLGDPEDRLEYKPSTIRSRSRHDHGTSISGSYPGGAENADTIRGAALAAIALDLSANAGSARGGQRLAPTHAATAAAATA